MTKLTADLVMSAYAAGIFPMAEAAETDSVFWVDPERRGIIPLEGFHVPKRLARTVRTDKFEVTCDQAFPEVIAGCAEPSADRDSTWINSTITDLFTDLFKRGTAHSVECWQDGELVGGLYGLALRGAFFGESMFSRTTDASKVALVHLVARLKTGGFSLLDTQFVTAHLSQFGAVEIPRTTYHRLLGKAMSELGDFYALPSSVSGARAMQSITQMS